MAEEQGCVSAVSPWLIAQAMSQGLERPPSPVIEPRRVVVTTAHRDQPDATVETVSKPHEQEPNSGSTASGPQRAAFVPHRHVQPALKKDVVPKRPEGHFRIDPTMRPGSEPHPSFIP
eukprot:845208-Rhodomonas_salina.4